MTSEPAVAMGKRERIMDAALSLFTERGFHGAAVPEVARLAGVGAGTIYRYFPSKEALVNSVYREQKQLASGYLLGDFPMAAPVREQFHVLWQRLWDWARAHPLSVVFMEMHHHASYLDEESLALEKRLMLMTESILARGQQARAIKDLEPSVLIGFIQGAFVGLFRGFQEKKFEITDALVDATEQCAWEAIRL